MDARLQKQLETNIPELKLTPHDKFDRAVLATKLIEWYQKLVKENTDEALLAEIYFNACPSEEGECENDKEAISVSEDGGAYVMTWTWVSNEEAGIEEEEEEEEEGDDLCDICHSSGVQVARTYQGKTVGTCCDATAPHDEPEVPQA